MVKASDQRIPERTATAQVEITVTRDNELPFFTSASYFVRIGETNPVGDTIISVFAQDNDRVVRAQTVRSVVSHLTKPVLAVGLVLPESVSMQQPLGQLFVVLLVA